MNVYAYMYSYVQVHVQVREEFCSSAPLSAVSRPNVFCVFCTAPSL